MVSNQIQTHLIYLQPLEKLQFFDQHIKNKNYTFLVIGNRDLVDHKALKNLGDYKELTLETIFGY